MQASTNASRPRRTFDGLLAGCFCALSSTPHLLLFTELSVAAQKVVQGQLLPQGGVLAAWLRLHSLALACRHHTMTTLHCAQFAPGWASIDEQACLQQGGCRAAV